MGQHLSFLNSDENSEVAEPAPMPAFVVPPYIQFTARQLQELVQAGQQPGVPFQIGAVAAARAVGTRKKTKVIDLPACVLKNSVYFDKTRPTDTSFHVGLTYDSELPLQISLYLTAKDRSDSMKLKISDSRLVLGPFNVRAGSNVAWSTRLEGQSVDILTIRDTRREDMSSEHDIIVVTKSVFPKGSKARDGAIVFQATMCRLPSPDLLFVNELFVDKKEDGSKQPPKQIPLNCVAQKVQGKSGVFLLEDIYGLDVLMKKNREKNKQLQNGHDSNLGNGADPSAAPNNNNHSEDEFDNTGECVICLTDPRSVALYPCRHWCLCMACAEALPSQGNKCPICRHASYLLVDFKSDAKKGPPSPVAAPTASEP